MEKLDTIRTQTVSDCPNLASTPVSGRILLGFVVRWGNTLNLGRSSDSNSSFSSWHVEKERGNVKIGGFIYAGVAGYTQKKVI